MKELPVFVGELSIDVPMTPPSVNHYKTYRAVPVKGRVTVMHYHTKEAKAWWGAVAASSAGKQLQAEGFEITYVVYQGHNERGDVDNYAKCILDALVKAAVIDSDHKVTAMHAYKARDRVNPRTRIIIRPVGQLALLDAPMPSFEDNF